MKYLVLGCLGLTLVFAAYLGARSSARASDGPATQPATQPARAIPAGIAAKLVPDANNRVHLTEEEWKQILAPEQFRILRGKGTEPPFRNAYFNSKGKGTYACAGCGQHLFVSAHKYDSGTGWPSYWQPAEEKAIGRSVDHDLGYARTEVHCSRCGGHLGHVFEDGPPPTGLRYCINSAALQFLAE